MKRVVEQPVSPGGNIDALLGAFYKGEMPEPWPAFQPPRRQSVLPFGRAKSRPRFALGSRLALAASVLLLLLGGWLLCDQFPGLPQPSRFNVPNVEKPDADSRHGKPPVLSPDPTGPGHKQQKPPVESSPLDLIPRIKEAVPGKVNSIRRLEQDIGGTGIRGDVKTFSARE